MRIAFLCLDYPLTPDACGASAVYSTHLDLIRHGGHEIHLVVLSNPTSPNGFAEFMATNSHAWQSLRESLKSFQTIQFTPRSDRAIVRAFDFVIRPDRFSHAVLQAGVKHEYVRVLKDIGPELVWAEDRIAGVLSISCEKRNPVIYSHLDWGWRIATLRHGRGRLSLRQRLAINALRRAETALVRKAHACLSGSDSEVREILAAGAKRAFYFPVAYEPVHIDMESAGRLRPRIVHLGSMKATANRFGLEAFMDKVWPQIEQTKSDRPDLWVIGNLDGASKKLMAALRSANAVCTGFVKNLTTVLRPFDIHIIPWEHGTGTRTRIPLVFNFGQALVAIKSTASCMPEVIHSHNALTPEALADMARDISVLLDDFELRIRIGKNARATFLRSFTREALQPRFNDFLNSMSQQESVRQ